MEPIKREKIWEIKATKATDETILSLAADAEITPVTARLLCNRGLYTTEAVRKFLRCEDTPLHDPFLLRDVEKAVERLRLALARHEKILIYGDYDVDGVTSVTLMYLYLRGLGADVDYYIPSRHGEGYGLSVAAIDNIAATGVTCIVTVDTGITAELETDHAASLGIDMVITDHHECHQTLPRAVAVVNPHRPDCPYPFKDLAGVGVAFKLITAFEMTLCRERGEPVIDGVRRVCDRFADLVAIGTIADVMPITDENRLIVVLGLKLIEETERPGLRALIEEAQAGNREKGDTRPPKKRRINSSFIGFGIAPRLNAAGRMSEATEAVKLLLAEEPEEATELARALCAINQRRQIEENRIAGEAYERIANTMDAENTEVFVLESNAWQQGIIGIVASRITERFGRPSILISFDDDGNDPSAVGKGSGRSVKGMNLVAALADSEELLVKFGGHELAAGLSITRGNIDAFRRRINEYAARQLPADGVRVSLEAECELQLPMATLRQAEEIAMLEPFGVQNPVPQFILRDLMLERITDLREGKHTKLLVSGGGVSMFALCFGMNREALSVCEGDTIDLLCTLEINEFRGTRSVQLLVQDIKPSAGGNGDFDAAKRRYAEIRAGGSIEPSEGFIPTREDFAHVYTVLRREFRAGRAEFSERALLSLVNLGAPRPIHYVCLKYMLEIFNELKICGVESLAGERYRFDIYFNATKANIEKSAILKMLRSRVTK